MASKGKFVIEVSVSSTTRFYLTPELTWTRVLDNALRFTTFNKAEAGLEDAVVSDEIRALFPPKKFIMPLIAKR